MLTFPYIVSIGTLIRSDQFDTSSTFPNFIISSAVLYDCPAKETSLLTFSGYLKAEENGSSCIVRIFSCIKYNNILLLSISSLEHTREFHYLPAIISAVIAPSDHPTNENFFSPIVSMKFTATSASRE